jgi:hypothetical protein
MSRNQEIVSLLSSSEDDESPIFGSDEEDVSGEDVGRCNCPSCIRSRQSVSTIVNPNFFHTARPSNNNVIDLLSDSDDDVPQSFSSISSHQRSLHQRGTDLLSTPSITQELARERLLSSQQQSRTTTEKTPNKRPRQTEAVEKIQKSKVKEEFPSKKFGEADNDDVTEVRGLNDEMEVEQSKPAKDICDVDDDDVITFVGGNLQGLGDMPHQRESCSQYQFIRSGMGSDKINSRFCSFCYCYICEIPASKCLEWNNHCQATYKLDSYRRENKSRKAKLFLLMNSDFRAQFWYKYSYIVSAANSANYSSNSNRGIDFVLKCFYEANALFLVIFKKFYDIEANLNSNEMKEGDGIVDWNSTILQSMVIAIQIIKIISDRSTTNRDVNLIYIVNETSVNFLRLFLHPLCSLDVRKACLEEMSKMPRDNHLCNLIVSISSFNDVALTWLQLNKPPPVYVLNLSIDIIKILTEAIIMNGGKDDSLQYFFTNYNFLVPYFCIVYLKRNIYGEVLVLLRKKITSLLKSSLTNENDQSKADVADRRESYCNLSGIDSISKLIFLLECCNESECKYFNLIKSIINEICSRIFDFDVYKKYQQKNVDNNMFPVDSIQLNSKKLVELYQNYKNESADSIMNAVKILESSIVIDTSVEQESQIDMVITSQDSQMDIANIAMISIIKILTKKSANFKFVFLDKRVINEIIIQLQESYKVILTHTSIFLASTRLSAPSESSSSSQSKSVVTIPGRTLDQILMSQLSLQVASTMCKQYSSNNSYMHGNQIHLYLAALPLLVLESWKLLPRSFIGCYPNSSLLGKCTSICDLSYYLIDYLNIPECINIVYQTTTYPLSFDKLFQFEKKPNQMQSITEINHLEAKSQKYCIQVIWKSFIYLVNKTCNNKLNQDPKSKKNNVSPPDDEIFLFFYSKLTEIISKLFKIDNSGVVAMTATEFEGKIRKIPDIEEHATPFIILFKLKEILKVSNEVIKNSSTTMINIDEFWINTISEFKSFIRSGYVDYDNLKNIKDFWFYIFGLIMRQINEINEPSKNSAKLGSSISFAILSDWSYVYTLLGTTKFMSPSSNITTDGKIEVKKFFTSLIKLNDTSFESEQDISSLCTLMTALCQNVSVKSTVLPIIHQIASLETPTIFDTILKYDDFKNFCYFTLLTLNPSLIEKLRSKPLNQLNSIFFEKEFDNLKRNIVFSVNKINKGTLNNDGLISNSNIIVSLALLGHFNLVKTKLLQDYAVENLITDVDKHKNLFEVLTMLFSKFNKNIKFDDAIVILLDPWISVWYQIDRINARIIIENCCDWTSLLPTIDNSDKFSIDYKLYIKELMVYHCSTESSVNDYFGLLSISKLDQPRIDYSTNKVKTWIVDSFHRSHVDICVYLDIICKHFPSEDLVNLLSHQCLDELCSDYDTLVGGNRFNKLDVINACISLACSYESHRKVLYGWLSKIILSLPYVPANIRKQIGYMLQLEIDIAKAASSYDESLKQGFPNLIGNQINEDFYTVSVERKDEDNMEVIVIDKEKILPYTFSLGLLQLVATPNMLLFGHIKSFKLFEVYKKNIYTVIVESDKLETCANILMAENEFSILFEEIISHIKLLSNIILKEDKLNNNGELVSLLQVLELLYHKISKDILISTKFDCADNVSMWIELFINPKSFLYEVMFLLREAYCIFDNIDNLISIDDTSYSRYIYLFTDGSDSFNRDCLSEPFYDKFNQISSKIIELSNDDELIRSLFSCLKPRAFTATAMQGIIAKFKENQSTLTDSLLSLDIPFPLKNLFQVIYSTVNSYSKFELTSTTRVRIFGEIIKICNDDNVIDFFNSNDLSKISLKDFLHSIIYGPVAVVATNRSPHTNPSNNTVYNVFTDVNNLKNPEFWIELNTSISNSKSNIPTNVIEDSIMSFICKSLVLDTIADWNMITGVEVESSFIEFDNNPLIKQTLISMSDSNSGLSHLGDLCTLGTKFNFNTFKHGLISVRSRSFYNSNIWEHIAMSQVILRMCKFTLMIDDINEILKLLSMDFSVFDYVLEKDKANLLSSNSSLSQYYLTIVANILYKMHQSQLFGEFGSRKINLTENRIEYNPLKLLRYPVLQDNYFFIKGDVDLPRRSLAYISNIISYWKYIIYLIYESIELDKIEEEIKSFTQKINKIGHEFFTHLIAKGVRVDKVLKDKFVLFCELLNGCLNCNYSAMHIHTKYPLPVVSITHQAWILFRKTAQHMLKSKKAVLKCVP